MNLEEVQETIERMRNWTCDGGDIAVVEELAKEVKRLTRLEAEEWGIQYCCNEIDCGCKGMPVDPPSWWTPDIRVLQEENTQMREALRFYANEENYKDRCVGSITFVSLIERDYGDSARAALPKDEKAA